MLSIALSVKKRRIIEAVYYLAMINLIIQSVLCVENEFNENQYCFLTIVVLQALLMHHVSGSLISVFITYTSFTTGQYFVHGGVSLDAVILKVVWLMVQLLSTLAIYMLVSAIGQLYVSERVSTQERNIATKSKADNVLVLR